MNKIALKACPFCNGNKIYVGEDELKRPYYYCRDCFAQTDSRLDSPSALDLWNSRPESKLTLSREKLINLLMQVYPCSDRPTIERYADAIKAKEAELREGQNETR